jgi:hypothetical protein
MAKLTPDKVLDLFKDYLVYYRDKKLKKELPDVRETLSKFEDKDIDYWI